MTVIPLELPGLGWTKPEDFPQHHAGTMQWAKTWLHERGISVEEARVAVNERDPLLVRRIVRSAGEQEATKQAYAQIQYEAMRAGKITAAEMSANLESFIEETA